jgi:sphinganine-1-phosphate aldolase
MNKIIHSSNISTLLAVIKENKLFITCLVLALNSNYPLAWIKDSLSWLLYRNKQKDLKRIIFNIAVCFPRYRSELNTKMAIICTDLKKSTEILEKDLIRTPTLSLEPTSANKIIENIIKNSSSDLNHYSKSKLSGTLYNIPSKEEIQLLKNVLDSYYKTNPLHSDIYPSLITMEKDIVSICKDILSLNTSEGCGTLTTGGTESIILALYTYREWAKTHRSITSPEVVALSTIHPAFDKGCHYLGITLRKIDVDHDNNINESQLSLAINHNTILLVGSAPSFPHGLIDDFDILARKAKEYDIFLHVDACLGGFVYPFLYSYNSNYNHLDLCDFRNQQVTSISIDTHKYGLCPKGSSVILFKNKQVFEHCYFIKSEWSGGIYATTNITGSRSGLNVAWTWALLNSLGKQTYFNNAVSIIYQLEKIKKAFANNPDIFIFGKPLLSVVAFGSNTIDIYKISQLLKNTGWNINELQNPPSFHLCITNCHSEMVIDAFIAAIKKEINNIKELLVLEENEDDFNDSISIGSSGNNNQDSSSSSNNNQDSSSIYGTSQKVGDPAIIDKVVISYLNTIH